MGSIRPARPALVAGIERQQVFNRHIRKLGSDVQVDLAMRARRGEVRSVIDLGQIEAIGLWVCNDGGQCQQARDISIGFTGQVE